MLKLMSKRTQRAIGLVAVLLLLVGAGVVSAQAGRELVPGVSVDSRIDENSIAQVFTYNANADERIKLTLISSDGLALGMVVTDKDGETLGQASDARANGFLVLDNVQLGAADVYYVVVFPLAVADVPTEGEFSLSLALASGAASVSPTSVATDATPEPTAQPTEEEALVTEEATVEDIVLDAPTGFTEPGEVLTSAGIEVTLSWASSVDLNLEVRDPVGGTVFWNVPAADSGGVFNGANVNGACETFTANNPQERINWTPGAVPTGSYEILVFYVQDCASNGAIPFEVNVTFDGTPVGTFDGTMLPTQTYIASFFVDADASVQLGESGIEQNLLPDTAAAIQAAAQPLESGAEVSGEVTSALPYEAYTFTGSSGDVIGVTMNASGGSLDPYLYLLDAAGNVVAENDDADAETRNAALSGVILAQDGEYTLVATRYGQNIGGTEGTYQLTFSDGADANTPITQSLLGVTLPEGIIEVLLIWNNSTDLQLLVRDPAGDSVFDDTPQISSGGILGADGNVNCIRAEGTPYSYVYWPAGQRVRPGTYEIDVWFQNNCGDVTPVNATLVITLAGNVVVSDTFTPLPGENYITTFSIGTDGSIVRGPGGIAGGSETVNYIAALADAPTLTSGAPISGTITDDNRFDVYTFEGTANETISLRMDATAGTLDTLLFLVGPTGIELASNDDFIPNETTNSAIVDYVLPQTGQYIVIATHYGTIYGGTNGTYSLVFSRLN